MHMLKFFHNLYVLIQGKKVQIEKILNVDDKKLMTIKVIRIFKVGSNAFYFLFPR